MIPAAARDLINKPLIARLATLTDDGYPHVVPLWFDVDGDDLVIMTDRDNRKVKNALANPKGAIQIGGQAGDGGGYCFSGDFIVEEDTDHNWMKAITYRYEDRDAAERLLEEWKNDDVVVIRLKVKRAIRV